MLKELIMKTVVAAGAFIWLLAFVFVSIGVATGDISILWFWSLAVVALVAILFADIDHKEPRT
jgi:hypothetical protein